MWSGPIIVFSVFGGGEEIAAVDFDFHIAFATLNGR